MSDVSIVLFATGGVVPLRDAVRNLLETGGDGCQIVVMAHECREDVATYLTRECLKGTIAGFGFDPQAGDRSRCGFDGVFYLTSGRLLVRTQDDVRFRPGWLERTAEVLERDPKIGCLGYLPAEQRRRRGRPPKPRGEAETVAQMDWRCFATRRDVILEHEPRLLHEAAAGWDCPFRRRLREMNLRLAYLPAQATAVSDRRGPLPEDLESPPEAALPLHGGELGAKQRLQQVYRVGDDLAMTCLSCGNTELEVLTAQVEFCHAHQVPVGFSYTLRCSVCRELHYEEDLQFQCPQ